MTLYGGLDIGRFRDHTALICTDDLTITSAIQLAGRRYKDQAIALRRFVNNTERTFVDVTGMGEALYEELEDMKLPVTPVTIGNGRGMRLYDGRIRIGKSYLVQMISSTMSGVKSELKGDTAMAVRDQFANFVVKPGKVEKFEARLGHDDLVVAYGLSLIGHFLHRHGELAA